MLIGRYDASCRSICFVAEEDCLMDKKIGDVLTTKELSVYLKIPKSTLYKLVREGKVPARKVGRRWRFWKKGHRPMAG